MLDERSDATKRQLLSITAHARAGALAHAWELFRAAGFDRVDDDPAVLTLKGRLLKDEALLRSGPQRAQGAGAAAAAYSAAARLAPAPYPLINAATLALIAGDRASSVRLANEALDLVDRGVPDETPYWLEATRAEALLLAGMPDAADAALDRARAAAPRAWEDHASTLRQLRVILGELARSDAWLDRHRPPRSLHFTGHLTVPANANEAAAQVDAYLAREQVGFGFGALAAGADIVVAERLLAAGGELHVVLPGPLSTFVERSVRIQGKQWLARFERTLGDAASAREVGDAAPSAFAASIGLADLISMGCAAINGQMLESEAIQLLLGPTTTEDPGFSAEAGKVWRASGRRQHLIPLRRARPATREAGSVELVTVLAVDLVASGAEGLDALESQLIGRLELVEESLADFPPSSPGRWSASRLLLAFNEPAAAVSVAEAIAERGEGSVRLALHVGLALSARDPVSGQDMHFGGAFSIAEQIVASAPPGALYASGDCIALLAAGGSKRRWEFVGELARPGAEPIALHALQPGFRR